MGDKTGIQWTDATWNPIVGCSIVSPGCTNCYAMTMAARIQRMTPRSHYAGTTQPSKAGKRRGAPSGATGKPKDVWSGKLALAPDHILTAPLRWKRPRRIFVNSMGDLFHEDAPDEWIDRVFAIMALSPQHQFQILTKRAGRMREYVCRTNEQWHGNSDNFVDRFNSAMDWNLAWINDIDDMQWPLPNVWLGVSAERRKEWLERTIHLRQTPAAVRFVSAEPLLGDLGLINLDGIDWVIVGGESGKDARPMHPDWARSIRDQCATANVPYFFKQWGSWREAGEGDVFDTSKGRKASPPAFIVDLNGNVHCYLPKDADGRVRVMLDVGKHRAGRLLDGREWNQFPEKRHAADPAD